MLSSLLNYYLSLLTDSLPRTRVCFATPGVQVLQMRPPTHPGCPILVSSGCRNKLPQTGGLNMTEISFLPILEARSLQPGCWQGRPPSEGSRWKSSLASCGHWWLWAILGFGQSKSGLRLTSRGPLLFCVSLLCVFYRHLSLDVGPYQIIPVDISSRSLT